MSYEDRVRANWFAECQDRLLPVLHQGEMFVEVDADEFPPVLMPNYLAGYIAEILNGANNDNLLKEELLTDVITVAWFSVNNAFIIDDDDPKRSKYNPVRCPIFVTPSIAQALCIGIGTAIYLGHQAFEAMDREEFSTERMFVLEQIIEIKESLLAAAGEKHRDCFKFVPDKACEYCHYAEIDGEGVWCPTHAPDRFVTIKDRVKVASECDHYAKRRR